MNVKGYSTQQGQPGSPIPGGGVYPGSQGAGGIGPLGGVSIGGNTIDTGGSTPVDVASLERLDKMVKSLDKLTKRLAPPRLLEKRQFKSLPYGSITRVVMGGNTFNGFAYSLTKGTIYVYLGENVDFAPDGITTVEPPDFIFVGGTSSGYLPIASDTDAIVTLVSQDPANPATGTLSLVQY